MDTSILDASFNDASTKLSEEDYQEEVADYVRAILAKNFPESKNKRTLRKYPGRINFACPLCGDSGSDTNKKRGNIILKGKYAGFYKCHNCGAMMGVVKFLKKCGVDKLDTKLVSYANAETRKNQASAYSNPIVSSSDMLFCVDEIEELCVTRDELKEAKGLVECDGSEGDNYGMAYLHNRLQYDHQKFLYDRNGNYLYVLNLTPSGKIFGLQTRDLDKKRADKFGKYKTYSLSKIHTMLLGRVINEEYVDLFAEYDSTSMIYNVLMVDYNNPVFVTEGPMDAILLRNAIALCGGSKKIDLGVDLYYIYDSDPDGVKYAIKALDEGTNVFMWAKYVDTNGLPKRRKWDINDLFLYYADKRMNVPNFMPFFTNDGCDALYL